MRNIDTRALIRLKAARPKLTPQQYRTIKGQILAGYPVGAMKGLENLLDRKDVHA